MRPNGFVLLVAGAATMLPLPATAQQPALPIVGILNSTTSGLRPFQEVASSPSASSAIWRAKPSGSNTASPMISMTAYRLALE